MPSDPTQGSSLVYPLYRKCPNPKCEGATEVEKITATTYGAAEPLVERCIERCGYSMILPFIGPDPDVLRAATEGGAQE